MESTKVEIKSCFQNAAENGLKRIHNSLVWIDYLEKHRQTDQEKPIKIIEIPITNMNDAQIIKAALEDYHLIWRSKISNMRCPLHHLPPGVRGLGTDLFCRATANKAILHFFRVVAGNLYGSLLPD